MIPPGLHLRLSYLLLKKYSNDHHVKCCSPVNKDGRRKAGMAQNDQPIADRNEDREGKEDCGRAALSPKEECQDHEAREDVANSLNPHERKGGGVVDRYAVGRRGANRVEDEVDADPDDRDGIKRVNQKSGELRLKAGLAKLAVVFIWLLLIMLCC